MKFVLTVCDTASFAHVSRLSLKSNINNSESEIKQKKQLNSSEQKKPKELPYEN